jgi:hypothetical protein
MRCASSSSILASTVESQEHQSERYVSLRLLHRCFHWRISSAMFHLDYLSCFLTVLATILLARKCWIGLVLAMINSVIVCAIGLQTLQLGFIPANLFCIGVYGFSMRSWLKQQAHVYRDQAQRWDSDSVEDGRIRVALRHDIAAGSRRFPSGLNAVITAPASWSKPGRIAIATRNRAIADPRSAVRRTGREPHNWTYRR